MNRQWIPLVCAGALFALAGSALAEGVFRNGLGARSIGRGGTNIAHTDNGVILLDNPAGAVNIAGSRITDIGFDLMLPSLHYSDPSRDAAANSNLFPLAQVAFIRKSRNDRWAYGVGFFVPAGFSATYDIEGPPALPGPRRYKSIGAFAKVLPMLAYRLTDRLSVGTTLGVGISHMELEGPYFLQGPNPFRSTPTMLDLQDTGAAICWSIGLQYQLTEATTVGVTYQSECHFHLDGTARVDIPGLGQSAFDSQLDVTWPRSLGLGVRHELCPHRILSTDVIWFDWSRAFDAFDLHLTNPRNLAFPPIEESLPLDWRDSVSVRVGYERLFARGRTLRFGYVYHPNPIPDRTLTPYIQAIGEHSFSLGLGWVWQSWDVDLAYMFNFGPERSVGTSGLLGNDFDLSNHRAQVHCIAFSFLRQF